MTSVNNDGAVLVSYNDLSSVGYFVSNAVRVMHDMKRSTVEDPDFELHDGMGEDSVVTELMTAAVVCIQHFNRLYFTDEGYWLVGVLDYDVWDSDEGLVTDEFYRVIVAVACERAEVESYAEVVDAYAMRMGWLPGRGGVPAGEDLD